MKYLFLILFATCAYSQTPQSFPFAKIGKYLIFDSTAIPIVPSGDSIKLFGRGSLGIFAQYPSGSTVRLDSTGGTGTLTASDSISIRNQSNALYLKNADSTSQRNRSNQLYEPVITTGTSAQYWRGDKTWQTLPLVDSVNYMKLFPSGSQNYVARRNYFASGEDTVLSKLAVEGVSPTNPYLYFVDKSQSYYSRLTWAAPSANRTNALPNSSGTILNENDTANFVKQTNNTKLILPLTGTTPTGVGSIAYDNSVHDAIEYRDLGNVSQIVASQAYVQATYQPLGTYLIPSDSTSIRNRSNQLYQGVGTYLVPSDSTSQRNRSNQLYEPTITTGTSAQYWRGDKTWQTLNQAAVAGLTTSDSPTFSGLTSPSLTGSTSTGGTLTLNSTSHATKGKILFGTSAYDEVNNRLGVGTTTPSTIIHASGTGTPEIRVTSTTATAGSVSLAAENSGTGYIWSLIDRVNNIRRIYQTSTNIQVGDITNNISSNNIGLNQTSWGTSAAKVIGIGSGTAPTTSPADAIQLWAADRNATAGKSSLHLRTEDGTVHCIGDMVGLNQTAPTALLHLTGTTSGHLRMDGLTSNPAAVTAGDAWYNQTQKSMRFASTVGTQGLVGLIYTSTANSNTVSGTVTKTAFNHSFSLPANSLTAGKVIRLRSYGVWTITSGQNQIISLDVGGVMVDAVTVAPAAALTGEFVCIEAEFTQRTVGATGTTSSMIRVTFSSDNSLRVHTSTAATINTTQANSINFSTTQSNTFQSMTLYNTTIEVMD